MFRKTLLCTAVGTACCAVHEAQAQIAPLVQEAVTYQFQSGPVPAPDTARSTILEHIVHVPSATWIRLSFDDISLGRNLIGGEETILRVTSLTDGAVQRMNATHLRQWGNSTAYFNGPIVLLEVIASPGAEPSHVTMSSLAAGAVIDGGVATICGPTDDRVPSDDPRAGRALPIGCTGWLINDANGCLLTAGHCIGGTNVMEFNVPFSDAFGNVQHPGPEDQYAVDQSSKQGVNGGVGNDWAYYGCFENTNTGLTPFEAQGDSYILAENAPAGSGQPITIIGYGVDSSPPEWNQVQQIETGPYAGNSGTTVQYQTDTMGGNSGSGVLDETTGLAIGIHTHGGCDAGGGANLGTAIQHSGLQNALANPQGVCIPLDPIGFAYPDGLPDMIPSAGMTVRVEVFAQNKGIPEPGTGKLHYDYGNGLVTTDMIEVEPNVYDAVFPPGDCETIVSYYFSAETTEAQSFTDPREAPAETYSSIIGDDLNAVFDDDFESDLGWTVSNSPGLTTGQWQRGVPVGGGDRGDPPTDADGSGQCYVTGIADGDNDIDDGSTTLTSPVLDATQGDAHITYYRWYDNTFGGAPMSDIFVVEISNNGGASWIELETVGPGGPEVQGGWFHKNFRIADFITPTDMFRIRFTASDLGEGSVVEAGVDGVRLNQSASGVICDDDGLVGDLDGDGTVGPADLAILLGAWGPCPGCPADLDGDGIVGAGDLALLLGNWTG